MKVFAQQDSLADLSKAYTVLSGVPQTLSGDLEDLYEALADGKAALVELPWFEQRDGETITRNQVLVQDSDGDRLYFANPRHGAQAVGETVAANGQGPERLIEADGIESIERTLFEKLFVNGGGLAMFDADDSESAQAEG